MKQIKTGNLTRYFNLDRAAIDEEARTVGLSFSSDAQSRDGLGWKC